MSYRGRLLVAQPGMLDPNFFQTVIFLIEHNEEGSLGVVLNRPLDARADEHAEEWSEHVAEPAVIFSGGPVGQGSALALGECSEDGCEAFVPITDTVGLIELDRGTVGVDRMRLFSGYSGWGESQVEAELAADAWFVVDSLPSDVFTRNPAALWSEVLKRQGGELARLAFYPTDPSLN